MGRTRAAKRGFRSEGGGERWWALHHCFVLCDCLVTYYTRLYPSPNLIPGPSIRHESRRQMASNRGSPTPDTGTGRARSGYASRANEAGNRNSPVTFRERQLAKAKGWPVWPRLATSGYVCENMSAADERTRRRLGFEVVRDGHLFYFRIKNAVSSDFPLIKHAHAGTRGRSPSRLKCPLE